MAVSQPVGSGSGLWGPEGLPAARGAPCDPPRTGHLSITGPPTGTQAGAAQLTSTPPGRPGRSTRPSGAGRRRPDSGPGRD